jgi:hypothetical protein
MHPADQYSKKHRLIILKSQALQFFTCSSSFGLIFREVQAQFPGFQYDVLFPEAQKQ